MELSNTGSKCLFAFVQQYLVPLAVKIKHFITRFFLVLQPSIPAATKCTSCFLFIIIPFLLAAAKYTCKMQCSFFWKTSLPKLSHAFLWEVALLPCCKEIKVIWSLARRQAKENDDSWLYVFLPAKPTPSSPAIPASITTNLSQAYLYLNWVLDFETQQTYYLHIITEVQKLAFRCNCHNVSIEHRNNCID